MCCRWRRTMSNPVQHLLEAFNGISQCIQTQLSGRIILSNQPSTLLHKNDNSLASLSSHSAGASHPSHPPGTRQKQKFSGLRRKKGHCSVSRQQKKDVKELMAIFSRMYPCEECADHFREA